ncbi:hypothetical protein SD70_11250 [Gordoniibacillus kamchatkensis]|uniref:Chemotaxis phosphatase CheX-like domain-containing protein n=1 Tax=Gordoniibacillus kamchatkensis TaxID=1590651 RepID=A0ABR5AIV0_9BACL|nr:hypothetical protein SD70_11250 [Paenibacillus sp. VKM B-2647]
MSLNERANDLLEGAMASAKQVLHVPIAMGEPEPFTKSALHSEMCVLIGFTGDMEGQLIIDGGTQAFSGLGGAMFGMALEGEMLHSFVGEIANMMAGNLCTYMSLKERKLDITPPTILMGDMKLFPFVAGFSVPIGIEQIGQLNIVLLIHTDKAG